jgi:thioredoxin-related protein
MKHIALNACLGVAVLWCTVCPAARSVSAAEIQWSTDIESSLRSAAAARKPVLLEFTASWCVYCKRMEKTTFTDAAVSELISSRFVAVRVDADKHKDLVKQLEVRGLPAILVVSPELMIIEKISGFQTPEALIQKLSVVLRGLNQSQVAQRDVTARESQLASGQDSKLTPRQGKQPGSGNAGSGDSDNLPRLDLFEDTSEAGFSESSASENSFVENSDRTGNGPVQEREGTKVHPVSRQRAGSLTRTRTDTRPAFDGVCIITASEDREIVPGKPECQLAYHDKLLCFRSPAHRDRFAADPERYWPMLEGLCAVTLAIDGKRVEGDFQYAAMFRKRVWLFETEELMRTFLQEPAEYAEEALEQLESQP